ncbi:hypothetical protein R6Q57_014784, partial [Mikania cordata]
MTGISSTQRLVSNTEVVRVQGLNFEYITHFEYTKFRIQDLGYFVYTHLGIFRVLGSACDLLYRGFRKCVPKLISSPLINQAAVANSTVTKETYSQLNPNCEPYVPNTSVEQVSSSSSCGQGNCDVKTFDPIEFHQK